MTANTPRSPFSPCESEDLPFTERYRVNSQGKLDGRIHERLFEKAAKGVMPQQAPETEFHDERFKQLYEEVEKIIDDWEKTGMLKETGLEPITEKEKYDARATPKNLSAKGRNISYATWSAVGFLALAVGCGAAYHRRADITETLENRLGGIIGNDNFGNDNFNNNRDSHNISGYNLGSYNRDGCNLIDENGPTHEDGCAGEYIPENCLPEEPTAIDYASCGEEGIVYCICDEIVCDEEETYSKEFPAILSSKENALAWTVKPASSSYLLSITSQEGACD